METISLISEFFCTVIRNKIIRYLRHPVAKLVHELFSNPDLLCKKLPWVSPNLYVYSYAKITSLIRDAPSEGTNLFGHIHTKRISVTTKNYWLRRIRRIAEMLDIQDAQTNLIHLFRDDANACIATIERLRRKIAVPPTSNRARLSYCISHPGLVILIICHVDIHFSRAIGDYAIEKWWQAVEKPAAGEATPFLRTSREIRLAQKLYRRVDKIAERLRRHK